MYIGLNACRQLATAKQPRDVRRLEYGEKWMRLMARCNNDQTRTQATIVCSNAQLCAGLQSSIKGNLHAVRAIWPQSTGWTHDRDSQERMLMKTWMTGQLRQPNHPRLKTPVRQKILSSTPERMRMTHTRV